MQRALRLMCPSECSLRGRCWKSGGAFVCECNDGWHGAACELETSAVTVEDSYDRSSGFPWFGVLSWLAFVVLLGALAWIGWSWEKGRKKTDSPKDPEIEKGHKPLKPNGELRVPAVPTAPVMTLNHEM